LHQETQRRLSQTDQSSTASVKYAPSSGGGQDQLTHRPKPNAPSGQRQSLKGSLSLQPERIRRSTQTPQPITWPNHAGVDGLARICRKIGRVIGKRSLGGGHADPIPGTHHTARDTSKVEMTTVLVWEIPHYPGVTDRRQVSLCANGSRGEPLPSQSCHKIA